MVRIYYGYLADQLQKKMMKNSKLKFSEYMQNISRSKRFGKFVLIVNFLAGNDYMIFQQNYEFVILPLLRFPKNDLRRL